MCRNCAHEEEEETKEEEEEQALVMVDPRLKICQPRDHCSGGACHKDVPNGHHCHVRPHKLGRARACHRWRHKHAQPKCVWHEFSSSNLEPCCILLADGDTNTLNLKLSFTIQTSNLLKIKRGDEGITCFDIHNTPQVPSRSNP